LFVELSSEQQISHPNQLIQRTIIFWIPYGSIATFFGFFLLSTSVHFQVILVGEPPSSICSFPLHLIMHLDRTLVGKTTCMLGELGSMSKNCPLTDFDKKFTDC
jgi:hypothetical protein